MSLSGMRDSPEYNSMLSTNLITEQLKSLLGTKRGGQLKTHCDLGKMATLNLKATQRLRVLFLAIGDQDVYSVMAAHSPHLFFTLPCE